ncbi:MAG: cytidine deaminase [Alphaproteobacteria bacterium]|nr:cytidine deaminase [Alphaproteobacteria bacterium]
MNNTTNLFSLATKAAQKAYCPYSKFAVGSAILSTNGNFYFGCNVENISYPVGTCAEAGAISAMIANGDTSIAEILIYADSQELISPCGACRQRIAEFATPQTLIHVANKQGTIKTYNITELLPHSFSEF